jgi:hypothetical protein
VMDTCWLLDILQREDKRSNEFGCGQENQSVFSGRWCAGGGKEDLRECSSAMYDKERQIRWGVGTNINRGPKRTILGGT